MLCPHCNTFIPTDQRDPGQWVSCGNCAAAVQVPDDAHADATLEANDTFFDDRKAAQHQMFRMFRHQSWIVVGLVLFVCTTIVGYAAWQANRSSQAVARVRELGGVVLYDYQFNDNLHHFQFSSEPRSRVWLSKLLGPDYVYDVTAVDLGRDRTFLRSELFGNQNIADIELRDFEPTISDHQLSTLAEMERLQMLSLADQPITDRGVQQIIHLERLVYLDLRNTRVSDQSVAALATLGRLKFLDLTGTEVSRGGYDKLRVALPQTTILRGRPFILH